MNLHVVKKVVLTSEEIDLVSRFTSLLRNITTVLEDDHMDDCAESIIADINCFCENLEEGIN